MNRSEIIIRNATTGDASAIIKVHHDAVHTTAANDYEAEILQDWSSISHERINNLKEQLTYNPEKTVMVVADIDGVIVGFAELVPDKNEVRAVYVSPTIGRSGVGKRLLQTIEDIASNRAVTELWLDSSVTAEPFYAAHGYEIIGHGEHLLRSGRKMKCVKMRKHLL